MNRKMEDMDKNVEMNAFIAELKENQRKIEDKNEYYDEAKDREDIQSYYSGVDFEKTGSKELFTKLNDLVTRTHHTKLPYSTETRNYLYSWADLQENGKLKSIYSGQQQNPEEVIKEDYKAFLRREKAYNTLVTKDKRDEKTLEVMKESIEKENKYNCEHVVPQSWFDKGNPMRGDLHHLFACEPKCNSSRSNHPFYDFADYSSKENDYITKSIEFIQTHYNEKIKVTDIAHYVSLNRSYLTTLFRKRTGVSIQQYLAQFRLTRAVELLALTDLSIEQIAESCGYSDPLVFSKAFKREKGISPTKYRERERLEGMNTREKREGLR
ncbi:helix-turn-helix domain-containing protein [Priestia filamentosa]|nr:AraC family transcriptional regulator [Priestia filamentosa]